MKLDLTKKISSNLPETMVYYYSELSEAIFLRKQNRFSSLGESQQILRKIIGTNIVYHEINVHAMLNLCEILLYELKFTNNPEILNDLRDLTDRLLKIAQQQFSRSLLAEVYWLKGRLELVNGNIKQTREFLSEAQTIAEGQDLENRVCWVLGLIEFMGFIWLDMASR